MILIAATKTLEDAAVEYIHTLTLSQQLLTSEQFGYGRDVHRREHFWQVYKASLTRVNQILDREVPEPV
ncbi:hypothetical protein LguiB_031918 [Lonicera macranthoides]